VRERASSHEAAYVKELKDGRRITLRLLSDAENELLALKVRRWLQKENWESVSKDDKVCPKFITESSFVNSRDSLARTSEGSSIVQCSAVKPANNGS
jgi:hypothetical protein